MNAVKAVPDILRAGVQVTTDASGSPRSIDVVALANGMKLTQVMSLEVGERDGVTETTLRLFAPFEYEGLVTLNTFQYRRCGCPCDVHARIERRVLRMKLNEIAVVSTAWTPEGERLPMVGNFQLSASPEYLEATADQADYDSDAPAFCACVCACREGVEEDA